jgi:hypothetical protein
MRVVNWSVMWASRILSDHFGITLTLVLLGNRTDDCESGIAALD